jgi:1-acyl-sn-glycerol-3-phosphate acyltransferase
VIDMKRQWTVRLYDVVYGAFGWLLMGLVGVPCWLLVLALPKLSWRWRVTCVTVHALCAGLRIPVTTVGEPPPPGRPCVIVANHGSILDSFAFFRVFPEPVVFVAGGDLAAHPIAGPFLRGLAAAFVRVDDRTDRSAVEAVLGDLAERARAGERLVFFPEGGLNPGPGLRRFQLGAFIVAGEVGSQVAPVAIAGTRSVLPPGARLPRRGHVELRFGEPLGPPPSGWRGAHEGARQARAEIEELLREAAD